MSIYQEESCSVRGNNPTFQSVRLLPEEDDRCAISMPNSLAWRVSITRAHFECRPAKEKFEPPRWRGMPATRDHNGPRPSGWSQRGRGSMSGTNTQLRWLQTLIRARRRSPDSLHGSESTRLAGCCARRGGRGDDADAGAVAVGDAGAGALRAALRPAQSAPPLQPRHSGAPAREAGRPQARPACGTVGSLQRLPASARGWSGWERRVRHSSRIRPAAGQDGPPMSAAYRAARAGRPVGSAWALCLRMRARPPQAVCERGE